MIELVPYMMAFSLIFAVIAACISILNWIKWNRIDPETMKARVFLNPSFLNSNFKLTFFIVIFVGGAVSLHSLLEYFQFMGIDFAGFYLLYYSILPIAMACLMLIAFMWYKLLNLKFRT